MFLAAWEQWEKAAAFDVGGGVGGKGSRAKGEAFKDMRHIFASLSPFHGRSILLQYITHFVCHSK